MNILVQWYERKPDFSPDYTKEHHGQITGKNAAECMSQYNSIQYHHDLNKYTIPAIIYVTD